MLSDVTLEEDLNTNKTIYIESDSTLDLSGHDLEFTGTGYICVCGNANVNLIIKDSAATTEPVVSDDYSTVTYNAGKIKATTDSVIWAFQGATVTLENGIIDASEGTYGIKLGNANTFNPKKMCSQIKSDIIKI